MSTKYLDKQGVIKFWDAIKAWLDVNKFTPINQSIADIGGNLTVMSESISNKVDQSLVSNASADIIAAILADSTKGKLYNGEALHGALKTKLDRGSFTGTFSEATSIGQNTTGFVQSKTVYSAIVGLASKDYSYSKEEANNKFAFREEIAGLFRFYGSLRSWDSYDSLATTLNQIILDAAWGEGTVVNMGRAFKIGGSGSTTFDSLFTTESVGEHPKGTNIVVINDGTGDSVSLKFDVLGGLMDLSSYVADDDALSMDEIEDIVNSTVTE